MTERQLRELRQQWERADDRRKAVRRAIDAMRGVEADLCLEFQRLTELIAEHDDTEIVITDDSNLDDVVRRAEAGELAMRVDVADIDGETA